MEIIVTVELAVSKSQVFQNQHIPQAHVAQVRDIRHDQVLDLDFLDLRSDLVIVEGVRRSGRPNMGQYIDPNKFINKAVITEQVEHFVPEHTFQDFKSMMY